METNVNKQKAFELFQKAAEIGNIVAQFKIANIYLYEKDNKNYDHEAFELSKKLAEKEYLRGMNLLGYCYSCGVGTCINKQKAFELYQKAADLGIMKLNINLLICIEEEKVL